jgi:calcium/calmodulin-dependent protein kinase I
MAYMRGGSVNDFGRLFSNNGLVSGEAANIVALSPNGVKKIDEDREDGGGGGRDGDKGGAGGLDGFTKRVASSGGLKSRLNAREFKRLTREHNPDDPLEAKRLTDADARLGRMRQGGKEVGPMRSYPGGFAVSRALGDFGSPAVICEPECTRLSLPPGGGRLILASDGLWNAMSDRECADIAAEAKTAAAAAEALIRRVMAARGMHDDITVLVVDLPPPRDMLQAAAEIQPDDVPAPFSVEDRDALDSSIVKRISPDKYYLNLGGGGGGGGHPMHGDASASRSQSMSRLPPIEASPRTSSVGRVSVVASSPMKPTVPPHASDVNGQGAEARRRVLEADVTVRKGVHFDPTDVNRGGGGGGGGGGGCFAFLCGGQSISAVDGVDDADAGPDGGLHDHYEIGNILGRGQYGSVRLATLKRSGEKFAVKSVAGDGSKFNTERIRDEVETMLVVSGRHPNLPALHSVYEQKSAHIVHMVTDAYLGGKMLDAIGRRKRFTVGDWEALAVQLLGAVSFMHTLGVVHRDLKPDNIMLKREWQEGAAPSLVVVDFGSAAFARGGKRLTGFEGTKFFAAPEVYRSETYGAKSDVWSVGVCLMVLLTGLPPNDRLQAVWGEMQQGKMPRMPGSTPKRFTKLIASLLVCEEEQRPSAAQTLAGAAWLLEGAKGGGGGGGGVGGSGVGLAGVVSHSRTSSKSQTAAAEATASVDAAIAANDGLAAAEAATVAAMHMAEGLQDGSIRGGRTGFAGGPGLPPFQSRGSTDNELEGINHRALVDSVRMQYERGASFILAVVLDPKQVRKLVTQLRKGGVEDVDAVPAALLEATLWTIGAREAAIQLELLRAQTFSSIAADIPAASATSAEAQRRTSFGAGGPGTAFGGGRGNFAGNAHSGSAAVAAAAMAGTGAIAGGGIWTGSLGNPQLITAQSEPLPAAPTASPPKNRQVPRVSEKENEGEDTANENGDGDGEGANKGEEGGGTDDVDAAAAASAAAAADDNLMSEVGLYKLNPVYP